jgi:hypothetical protein
VPSWKGKPVEGEKRLCRLLHRGVPNAINYNLLLEAGGRVPVRPGIVETE